MAEYTTILEGLAVMIRLGIHPHEVEPQRVLVTVEMTVAYDRLPSADSIAEVLDYDFVRSGILSLAKERRFALQETLCDAVAALCLSDGRVQAVRVRTSKTDVYPDAAIGCEVLRRQPG